MIAYVTLGADDLHAAERFYTALLLPLGYRMERYQGDLSFLPPHDPDAPHGVPDLYIKRPFNGAVASCGNGTMIALDVPTRADVRRLHHAACAAGGSDEGQPGTRADYNADFYVAYLRDPQGNKIALFSNAPD
nr:VOC family protein [Hasllibacter sp. MH4015]